MEMEKQESSRTVEEGWWWAGASTAQLSWGIYIFRKGSGVDSHFLPFKAFAVASLFVGAAATAATASLRASGVHSVQDLKTIGANIRRWSRNTPATRNE